MSGWIKLHRSLLNWEWYDDINVTRLFLHLMLKANHKDRKYKGTLIKRGQLLTGRELLSNETGLSQQQIRTCLTKLKSTSDITIKSTNKGTLLTVDNYGVYQGEDSELTSKSTSTLTNEQPTNNQRITTNKNVKKDKNVKNKDFCQLIANEYNQILGDVLPGVQMINDKRVSAINGTIKQFIGSKKDFSDIETWKGFFNFVLDSKYLLGEVVEWKASFDFLIKKDNVLKTCEGKYHNDN